MGRRTEYTLGFLSFFGVMALGVLFWGQQTGELPIFRTTFISSADSVGPVANETTASVVDATKLLTESFSSLAHLDVAATTAFWNAEAGEVTLQPGTTEGIAQTTNMLSAAASTSSVTLHVDETKPLGSAVYYALSTDGGKSWQPAIANAPVVFDAPPTDLRVRLLLDRGIASINPSAQRVQLQFE